MQKQVKKEGGRRNLDVDSTLRLGKLSAQRTVPQKIPRIVKTVGVRILPTAKSVANSISKIPTLVRLLKIDILLAVKIFSGLLRIVSRPVVRVIPVVKTVTRIPVSKIKYPSKEVSNIPNEAIRAIDEFSNLPMWFTMPIIFVTSITLGAVVSILVGYVI